VKFTKIFRILTLTAIVSLLLIAIPALPALAAKEITLDPEEGDIGTSGAFTVDGSGFSHSTPCPCPPGVTYSVDIYFSSQEAGTGDTIGTASGDDVKIYEQLGTDDIGTDGKFSKKITKVPSKLTDGKTTEDVHGGIYYVYVTMADDKDIEAVAEFTVIAGQITLDPTQGVVGTEVEITGLYFAARDDITVEYDGGSEDIKSGDETTDSGGGFENTTITIPLSTSGAHTIAVEDESGHIAEATFTVKPKITISVNEGKAGDEVTVTGTGFGDGVEVDITLDGSVVGSGETNEEGSFTASFEVPDVEEGSYDVTVGNAAAVEFTIFIATEVSISPVTTQASPGHVGTDITVSGVGFEPSSLITITYATEPIVVKTTTSDADGAFTATFKAPKSTSGTHTITASDGTNSLTTTFYMESTPPPIPEPLLPEMDTKAESPVYFNWEDVIDDSSPVTYSLQVATNDDFTPGSIVLEQEDLTDSEYTLTEEEKLEPRKKETPYYWRVKATDSASNESAWSAPGSFYTGGGFGFALPSWKIHLWWGLGVLAAGFAGYWLGRRKAVSSY
jgi:hypothetical protein